MHALQHEGNSWKKKTTLKRHVIGGNIHINDMIRFNIVNKTGFWTKPPAGSAIF